MYNWHGDEWTLIWRHGFSQPLLAVTYVDLIGDGINELVVLTNHGLQVLQVRRRPCVHVMVYARTVGCVGHGGRYVGGGSRGRAKYGRENR